MSLNTRKSLHRITPVLLFITCSAILGAVDLISSADSCAADEGPFVRLHTDEGEITLYLFGKLAPGHTKNFIHLSNTGFYDGTKFHRVIPAFMIQGGDPNSRDDDPRDDGMGGPSMMDILPDPEREMLGKVNAYLEKNGFPLLGGRVGLPQEFSLTAKHLRGTLSMARSQDPNSAGSQFFICVVDKSYLDGQYTVFGHTLTGMDVVDRIVNGEKSAGPGDSPINPVSIISVDVMETTSQLTAEELAAFAEFQTTEAASANK